MQIGEKKLPLLSMFFGVSHWSILGPVLFNLDAAELIGRMSMISIRWTDDTIISIYRHRKVEPYSLGRLNAIDKIDCDLDELSSWWYNNNPANIYLFKVSNRSTKTRCEICSKLTIKTPFHLFSNVYIVYCWFRTRKCQLRTWFSTEKLQFIQFSSSKISWKEKLEN